MGKPSKRKPKFFKYHFDRFMPLRKRHRRVMAAMAALASAAQVANLQSFAQRLPITQKESSFSSNMEYRVGSSCMQGWRQTMEDSHCQVLALDQFPDFAYFSVFDGHGGADVAKFAGQHMQGYIVEQMRVISERLQVLQDKLQGCFRWSSQTANSVSAEIAAALQRAFLNIDAYMQQLEVQLLGGSTAVVVLINLQQQLLFCANAGDSRAVASVNGKALDLSKDHKPTDTLETQRIKAAGGYVLFGRVNGNLAVSRALGDFDFKQNHKLSSEKQSITALPDVTEFQLDNNWEFIIIACDGIWDVLSSQEVVQFCHRRLAMGLAPEVICEQLMEHCLAPDDHITIYGGDNMTVIMVCMLHERSFDELVAQCAANELNSNVRHLERSNTEGDDVLNDIFGGMKFD